MCGMASMPGGMMLFMLIGGLIFVGVVVLAVIGAVSVGRRQQPGQRPLAGSSSQMMDSSGSDPAVRELRRRLATGEIDENEYLQRRSALE